MMDLLAMTQQGFDAFNNGTFRELEDLIDPNIVTIDVPQGLEMQGREAYFAFNEGFSKAMPDLQATIVSSEVSGNVVRVVARGTGTFTGQLEMPDGVIPGNGNAFDMEYESEFEYSDDGMLVRFTSNYDLQAFMGQLGLG